MGAHFEALENGVFGAPLDTWYTQVGFSRISVQVYVKVGLGNWAFNMETPGGPRWPPGGASQHQCRPAKDIAAQTRD